MTSGAMTRRSNWIQSGGTPGSRDTTSLCRSFGTVSFPVVLVMEGVGLRSPFPLYREKVVGAKGSVDIPGGVTKTSGEEPKSA
jgi:hypothetical protein